MKYYKAVDDEGFSFFPVTKSKRLNWIELVGQNYEMGDVEAFEEAVAKLREGDTVACTKHLLHGYADVMLAVDFGERHAKERGGGAGFRIVSFEGTPVAELTGQMLFNIVPWDESKREKFANAVKYGFRAVHNIAEVDLP
jgi:hypothetical protein